MKRINLRKLILVYLLVVFTLSTIIYLYDWITYNAEGFFSEAINHFYSKIYLLSLIFSLWFTNRFTYFLCLILLPLLVVYRFSGILYCCTTPFDYTFEISALLKEYTNVGSFLDAAANFIYGLPLYGNFFILIVLLLPKTRREYFNKKNAYNSSQAPAQDSTSK